MLLVKLYHGVLGKVIVVYSCSWKHQDDKVALLERSDEYSSAAGK